MYHMAQILIGENIDEFDEFLSIHQHFPYQKFPLIIFCCFPARPLFAQGVITVVYAPMQNFSLSKYIYQYS